MSIKEILDGREIRDYLLEAILDEDVESSAFKPGFFKDKSTGKWVDKERLAKIRKAQSAEWKKTGTKQKVM
jgi:hypothetical protein